VNSWKNDPLAVKMSAFETFADIPPEHLNHTDLEAWLRTPVGRLSDIPRDMQTERLCVVAVWTEGSLGCISFEDRPNYREIALKALKGGGAKLILQVEEAAITEQFLFDAVSLEGFGHYVLSAMMTECCDRFNRHISQRIIDKGLARSLRVAAQIRLATDVPIPQHIREMVSDQVLKKALINLTSESSYLKRLGKLHLLTQAINEGYWPTSDIWLMRRAPDVLSGKPDLSVAIGKRMIPENSDTGLGLFDKSFHAFFEAVILTYSIEEVLAQLTAREHAPVLNELYSTETLLPYLRQFPHLKSIVLEGALGL
jgi:hypothetical protein